MMNPIEPVERLAVCIVAHNEAENLPRTLASIRGWAGQIVVLDCESTDATAEVARSEGAEVHHAPNVIPEISKNRSFEHADREWILSLDADEIVPDALKREIAAVIASDPAENGFKIPRRNFYFGAPVMHGGNYPDKQLRLIRKGRGRFPGLGYHERMTIDGAIGELAEPFDHHPYPTFEAWMRKLDFYTAYAARTLAERSVPITPATIRHHMITRPLRRWFERLFIKRGIRDGVPGVLAASSDLITNILGFGRYWIDEQRRAR